MEKRSLKGLFQTEYMVKGNRPVLYLFRRENKKKVVEEIRDFLPYFYVLKGESTRNIRGIHHVEDVTIKSIDGEDVKKVVASNPYDIYNLRDRFAKTFEADIPYTLRYLIDNVSETTPEEYRVMYLDIETTTEGSFPNPQNPFQKITCISFYDNYSSELITLTHRKDFDDKKVKVADGYVYYFKEEKDMLLFFLRAVRAIDPDIMTAWFINFDLGYLISRMRKLGINFNKFSPLNYVKVYKPWSADDQYGDVVIRGRVVYDLMIGYMNIHLSGVLSYALDSVCQRELGTGKMAVYNFDDSYNDDIKNLIKYNRYDVELLVKLDKKLDILPYWNEMKDGSVMDNIDSCKWYSRIVDTLILRKYHNKVIFPTKGQFVKQNKEQIKGALVRKPMIGLWDDVVVFDYKALYPRIITTFNLSKECIIEEGDNAVNSININGTKIDMDKKGITPSIVKDMEIVRDVYTNNMQKSKAGTEEYKLWSRKDFAAKFITNSVPADTLVWVMDYKGRICCVPIKDVTINKYDKALSVNNKNKILEWKKLLQCHKHIPGVDKIYKFKTRYGFEVEATPNHSLFTYKDNKIVSVDCEDVKVGDNLVLTYPNISGNLNKIDITDYLSSDKLEVFLDDRVLSKKMILIKYLEFVLKKEKYRKDINIYGDGEGYQYLKDIKAVKEFKEDNYRYKYVITDYGKELLKFLKSLRLKKKKYLRGISSKKCWFVFSLKEYRKIPKSVRKNYSFKVHITNSGYRLDVSQPLREELLGMIGFYIAEGGYDNQCQVVSFSQKDDRYEKLVKKFCDTYDVKYCRSEHVNYDVCNLLWKDFFGNVGGIGSRNKHLPSFFFNLSEFHQQIIYYNYMNGDGDWKENSSGSISKVLTTQLLFYKPHSKVGKDYSSKNVEYYVQYSQTHYNRFISKELYHLEVISKIERTLLNDEYLYDLGVEDNQNFVGGDMGLFEIHNSLYGVHMLTSFRLYDTRIGEAITYLGRELNRWAGKVIEAEGGTIVYGDTDSLFVHLPKKAESVVEEGERVEKKINSSLIDFVKQFGLKSHNLRIVFEKYYSTILIPMKKKKYAGLLKWKKGKWLNKMDIVGFEARRSDISRIGAKVQETVLDMLLHKEDINDVYDYVVDIGKKIKKCEWLKDGAYTASELAIPKKLEKAEYQMNLPRVRAKDWSNNNLGTTYRVGSKFLMLYVDEKEMGTDVIAFDGEEQLKKLNIKINVDKNLEVSLFAKLKMLWESLNRLDDIKMLIERVEGSKTLREYMN